MVKGNWWKTFGFILVMYLLVGVVAYLFGIPYMFVMMSSAFTGAIPNIYEITFSLLLSYLGQYTLYTVLFVGVGMLFFSRSEEMEHTTLLSQIDQLGVQPEKKADEELIKYIILFVFVCVGNVTWAEEGERESSLSPDSSYVLRAPKADFLEKYRKDAAFDYTTNIEDSPSIWDWIKRWILERLFRIKVSEGSMQTMDIILKIVLGLFALGIVYLLVRNRDKFLFRRRETDFFPEDSVEYTGEQEADAFVRLLAKAEQENDYVLAIRVNYSALLQMLDKEEVIRWDVSKTNQHYIYEIKNEAWSRDFEEISRIFDCVCYGEFPVDETAYQNIKRYFTEFRKEVEG